MAILCWAAKNSPLGTVPQLFKERRRSNIFVPQLLMICHCCFIVNKKRKQRSPDENNIHKIRKTIYEFVMGPDKDFTAVLLLYVA